MFIPSRACMSVFVCFLVVEMGSTIMLYSATQIMEGGGMGRRHVQSLYAGY